MDSEQQLVLPGQDQIAKTLDGIKGDGLISDYLVTWSGQDGQLDPSVTVWSDEQRFVASIRDVVAKYLGGLVAADQIIVMEE